MAKPTPPSDIKVEGKDAEKGMSTHIRQDGSVEISAKIRPQQKQGEVKAAPVRLVVNLSDGGPGKGRIERSDWGGERRASVKFKNLNADTRYYVEVRVEQRNMDNLSNESKTNFWTDRRSLAPTLIAPVENAQIDQSTDVIFEWRRRDPDQPQDDLTAEQFRWRVAATSIDPAGPWHTSGGSASGSTGSTSIAGSNFSSYTWYDWEVRTKTEHNSAWGPWASRSFFIIGNTHPPVPDSPIKDEAAQVDVPLTFEWTFRDPNGDTQVNADLRYRVLGTNEWITVYGSIDDVPGGQPSLTLDEWTLAPGYHYEWQVRTYESSSPGEPSDWSRSGTFWSTRTPGWEVVDGSTVPQTPQGSLGVGQYRALIYDRGGERIVGDLGKFSRLQWGRLRDDISAASLRITDLSTHSVDLLSRLRCWGHEVVIFRNDDRVWEGPITRLSFYNDKVEIDARDPMIYVYRRIMRQGYNDNVVKKKDADGNVIPWRGQIGPRSVVDRASLIILNALAPDDPNVLPWMTRLDYPDDAKQSRIVGDWSKTAWEEVDDMARTAGLDYTVVGRRIILWDTHRPVGLLAEMRNGDFFDSPVISEYGMNAANVFGVTNNAGLYGSYEFAEKDRYGLGPIEMLASAYGESGAGGADPVRLTAAQREAKKRQLDRQASRNINGRWAQHYDGEDYIVGSPVIVRIPDNSRVHPNAAVGINQLVPGVHIPLRAETPARSHVQVQKLDSVDVLVEGGIESVQVVMSPAPLDGLDADAQGEGAAEE